VRRKAEVKVKTGLDILVEEDFRRIRGYTIGVVANQASTTRNLTHLVEEAKKKRRCNLEIVFSPEHGFLGERPCGEKIAGEYYDLDYNVRVFSLYGESFKPPIELLEKLDALIFDLQDVGVRWYTYTSTLYYCIEACGEAKTPIYVLDRPNPITGEVIEGPILNPKYKSFVGIAEVPVRYGLTIGELALLLNDKYNLKADLQVVTMKNWKRDYWFKDTGLPWILPSPNMPTPETALVYPGTALLEGTNISEGRGTTKPFELIGAPWIKASKLAKELNARGLAGVMFRPAYFRPSTSKYAGELCGGVQVHVVDREEFRAFEVGVHIICAIRNLYEDKLRWIRRGPIYFIDQLAGTNKLREMVDSGVDAWEIVDKLERELDKYVIEREKYLLYF